MDTGEQQVTTDFFKTDEKIDAQEHEYTGESVSWSASEFLHHQKSPLWYLSAIVVILFFSALSYLFTRDYIGPIAVVVLGLLLLVAAGRKPRTIEYIVDEHGVAVGGKEFPYDEFQSFTVIKEDQIESIALYPHKRFSPEISMYFAPEDGQKIFDLLSKYVPFEQREKDRIDKFLHKIRF